MRNFRCGCGQTLFFENTRCLRCGERVGFDPAGFFMAPAAAGGGAPPLCRNAADHDVCNWFASDAASGYCVSCGLNQTIPDLTAGGRRRWWRRMERAKRRLIYSLLTLRLPVAGKREDERGLAFAFIEDKRTNPGVLEDHVSTGHLDGLITINIAEADDVNRELTRQATGELYRTVLGHLRHESGHYYFGRLVMAGDGGRIVRFRELFGDERADYGEALARYYARPPAADPDMISPYAQAHPLEDWAEVWSHYLHMADTLETAADHGMRQGAARPDDIDGMLLRWSELSLALNALNRSMGLEDAYPFVLSDPTLEKLRFVHALIGAG